MSGFAQFTIVQPRMQPIVHELRTHALRWSLCICVLPRDFVIYNGPVKVCAKHSLDKERDEGESYPRAWRGNFAATELLSPNLSTKI